MEEQLAFAEKKLLKVEETGVPSVFLYCVSNFEGWRYDVCFYYFVPDKQFVAIVDEWPLRDSGEKGFHEAKEAPTFVEVFHWANEKTVELNSFYVDIAQLENDAFWHSPGDTWSQENK